MSPVVHLPNRATVAESYEVIQACHAAEGVDGPVEISGANTSFWGPFGVALVAATIAVRRERGKATALRLPSDPEANEFAEDVGLPGFASGEPAGPGTLEVRQLHALDAIYSERVTRILTRGVPGITPESAYIVQFCLNELLQNVFEWAVSPIGCCVHTRWYARTHSARLAVVDRGVGIPAALRDLKGFEWASEVDLVEAAVSRPRLTSRVNKSGGYGLKYIQDWVCGRGGRLTVVSLGAKVVWSGSTVFRYASPRHQGTAIEIDLRPTAPYVSGRHDPDIF